MKVLLGITYFRPYVSGLTVYADRLASALVELGHEVTILTSAFDASLPLEEQHNGVRVVRVPVSARLSKAVLMPSYPSVARRLLAEHDVVNLHLPQPEAVALASIAKFVARRPIVATYHCDLNLPFSPLNRIIDEASFANNCAAGTLADVVVAYTEDYANHSRFLKRFPHKRRIIPPPVEMPLPRSEAVAALRARYELQGATVIGFAARFATEKGVEYLLDALPALRERLGDVRVLFAGPFEDVIGEEAYRARLLPRIADEGRNWAFLGTLSAQELADFFGVCDVTVLPSVNSTESFGMVQVEAMLCGVPVCASNLPGVRVPIQTTGMGEVVPIASADGLARGILDVLSNRPSYVRPRAEIERHFSLARTTADYLELFASLVGQRARASQSVQVG